MAKKHVNINFYHVKQGDLIILAKNIVSLMTINVATFANPTPSLAEVSKAIDVYMTIYNKIEYTGRTGELRNARKVLVGLLKQLGMYVNGIANGDEEILERSGFPISKGRAPVGPLAAPDFLHVRVANEGGFECKASLVKNYWGYLFAFTERSNPEIDPENWTSHWSSKPYKIIKKGYTRGKEYKFAACAVASSEKLHWIKSGNVVYGS